MNLFYLIQQDNKFNRVMSTTQEHECCPICLEVLDNIKGNAQTECCRKIIHTKCLFNSAVSTHMTCPLCRASLVDKNTEEQSEYNVVMRESESLRDFMGALSNGFRLLNDTHTNARPIPDYDGHDAEYGMIMEERNTILAEFECELTRLHINNTEINMRLNIINDFFNTGEKTIAEIKVYIEDMLHAYRKRFYKSKYEHVNTLTIWCVNCTCIASYGSEHEPELTHCFAHKLYHEVDVRQLYDSSENQLIDNENDGSAYHSALLDPVPVPTFGRVHVFDNNRHHIPRANPNSCIVS